MKPSLNLRSRPVPVAGKTGGTEPMRIHKRLVIMFLQANPAELHAIAADWKGDAASYIKALEEHPGEWFLRGELLETGDPRLGRVPR